MSGLEEHSSPPKVIHPSDGPISNTNEGEEHHESVELFRQLKGGEFSVW
jgi:hypothetical protein